MLDRLTACLSVCLTANDPDAGTQSPGSQAARASVPAAAAAAEADDQPEERRDDEAATAAATAAATG